MKKSLQLLSLAIAIIFATCTNLQAQTDDSFVIKTPFKKSTYQGKELRKMKSKELKQILALDPPALSKFRAGQTLSAISTTLVVVGPALILFNTMQDAGSISDGEFSLDNSLNLVGLALVIAALPISITSGALSKSAIKNFHKKSPRLNTLNLSTAPIIGHNNRVHAGFRLQYTF